YGSKGTVIVLHILLQLFPHGLTVTDTFKPLPMLHYFSYFLAPHIIAQLITEDCKKTSDINTYTIMTASSDAGKSINLEHNDDDELNVI
ncbi:hypothetical protein J3R83DRAFT_10448, partial [Lanmaoa asiatica]